MEFAAHIEGERIQTVQKHCFDTSQLCAEYCSLFDAENIGKLQGLLHDAGKLCEEFDSYIRGNSSARRGEIDHSYAGAKFITEISDDECRGAALIIARTIISHHGLHDWVDEKCRNYFSERISRTKKYDQIKANIICIADESEIKELLLKASEEYKALRSRIKKLSQNKTECAFYLGALERMLESALIDADRTDTASFMSDIEIKEKCDVSELWKTMRDRINEKLGFFSDRTDRISIQRRSISDRCKEFAKNDVRVCRMIVPTGGGKTLSSLRFAIEYCIEHGMERIIYTAPFMSILEQNSDEIRSIAGDANFTEHHSDALAELDPDEDPNDYSEYELHTERWDSSVIATTMVQFLNTLFSGKSSSVRRMHRLCRSVIIIDEVQSLPIKCVNIFNLAINFLTNICGAVVVLCSATQPVTEETAYPMYIDHNASMTGDYKNDFEVFKRTDIIPNNDPYGLSYEETACFCMDKFREAGNLLIIVNTKSSALNVYNHLKEKCSGNTEVIHLSTNMCPQHRREKIQLIRELLNENKPVICVTTQLIEAGVDISFRCVVRSLAGLDNIVQAAGRCNRHGEAGRICPVYLIKIKDEKLGSLKEITSAQGITCQMLDSGKYSDLQSAEAVSDYFRTLYHSEEKSFHITFPRMKRF